MIKAVGLCISFEDLQNYDYKKIEKILKEHIINEVVKEVERSELNINFELSERFGKAIVRIETKVIIDLNTK